jgi:hypothetical protein
VSMEDVDERSSVSEGRNVPLDGAFEGCRTRTVRFRGRRVAHWVVMMCGRGLNRIGTVCVDVGVYAVGGGCLHDVSVIYRVEEGKDVLEEHDPYSIRHSRHLYIRQTTPREPQQAPGVRCRSFRENNERSGRTGACGGDCWVYCVDGE